MREALIQSTHLNRHRDLIHVLDSLIFIVLFIRMEHLVLIIFFKLEIALLKRFEVVEEWIQRRETLVRLIVFSSNNLALFKFFFLIVENLRFDTKSIHQLNVVGIDGGLEFLNLAFHFFQVLEQSLRLLRKVFNELCGWGAEDLVRVTSDFSSDLSDGSINIVVVALCNHWGLHFEDCPENPFHFIFHLAVFLTDDSDITEFEGLS